MERFGETKNMRCKTKVTLVEGAVQKWLVFIRFIREKLVQGNANLDQKTCKNKTVNGKIQQKQMQASQSQAIQALQQ